MAYRNVQVPLSDKEQEALRLAASQACRRPRDQARYFVLQALGFTEKTNEGNATRLDSNSVTLAQNA